MRVLPPVRLGLGLSVLVATLALTPPPAGAIGGSAATDAKELLINYWAGAYCTAQGFCYNPLGLQ